MAFVYSVRIDSTSGNEYVAPWAPLGMCLSILSTQFNGTPAFSSVVCPHFRYV